MCTTSTMRCASATPRPTGKLIEWSPPTATTIAPLSAILRAAAVVRAWLRGISPPAMRTSPLSSHARFYRKPVLPVRLHHGITVHDADATLKGGLRSPRDGSMREEKLMKRPLMVMPSVLLGLALVIAGCGGASTASGTNPSSKVSVTPPTSLIKAGTPAERADNQYSPTEVFSSARLDEPNPAGGV